MATEPKITLGDIDLSANMQTFVYTVSREYALDMGMIEPTSEELAERNESRRRFHESQREKRARFFAAFADLEAVGGLTSVILSLHAGDLEADWSSECGGCDWSGYEAEPPEWPCRTVLALAAYHGIDLPDSLPGKHYENEFVPSSGKVIEWPKPRWFVPE